LVEAAIGGAEDEQIEGQVEEMIRTDLGFVLDGWDGYHQSLVAAVKPLTSAQLEFRGAAGMRSVEELVWHIADGRVDWFSRMDAPGASALAAKAEARRENPPAKVDGTTLAEWLDETWQVIGGVLATWSLADLAETFRQPYQDKVFAVSRQWVVFRILLHDVHHGGQLSELLAMQGIEPVELTLLGGHITEPPEVEE
jgi:uncharacterized damage-inducible protein DinB